MTALIIRPLQLKNSFGQVYITISHDKDNQWVHNQWHGMLSADSVMEGFSATLQVLEENGFSKILNDNRNIVGSWTQANERIEREWMPKAIDSGLKRFAHILSPGMTGRGSAEDLKARLNDKVEMQLFEDIFEAQKWLRE